MHYEEDLGFQHSRMFIVWLQYVSITAYRRLRVRGNSYTSQDTCLKTFQEVPYSGQDLSNLRYWYCKCSPSPTGPPTVQ